MTTTRRLACTAILLIPGAALARPAERPTLPAGPQGCEEAALHARLRDGIERQGGPAAVDQARCPRCGCALAPPAPADIPDLRNLF